MYKLIIIDDEAYILNQLSALLDWEELGFEIKATFEYSDDIFDYLENNEVDVILSDVSMPYPNGLDIAKYCSEFYPDITVILVSGYRDFEYAQQAIKYNVFEYITKPISYERLYSCMVSLKDKLSIRKPSTDFINLSSLSSFQEVFFDLFYGRIKTTDNLIHSLKEFGLDDNSIYMPCAIISINIDNFDDFVKKNEKHDINEIYNAICNAIPCKTKTAHNFLIRYAYNTLEILTIKTTANMENGFEDDIQIISSNLEEILNLKITLEVSKIYTSLADLTSHDNAGIMSPIMHGNTLVDKVTEYIQNNYKNAITLEDIARYTAMSKGYFCSHYKSLTNESFITTLNRYRIDMAKELLKDPHTKSSSIGALVGFRNTQHFYRVFKSVTGMTPNIYQAKVNNNE